MISVNFKDTEIRVNSRRLVETIKNLSPIGGNGLEYINDVINDFGVVDYNDSLVGIKHLLMILDSALDIYKSLHDTESGKNPDLYREIAIEKATLLSLDHLKYVDDAFDAIYSICEDNSSAVIVGADRISLRYAYLIYLWTIRETYTGNDSVYVNNFVLERIEYLTISNHFDNYESAKIKKLVDKIIAVHSNRIDINREIKSFNSRLYDIFKNSYITTLIRDFNHEQKKDSNSDGEIISMEYNKNDIKFTFEYNDDKTTFGNTIRFGQAPVFASFKVNILGEYYTVFESKYIPFYGLKFTTNDIIKCHEYTGLDYTCREYMDTFNFNCEVCDTILLDEPSSVLTQEYHFNLFEFRGKLEKHIQVTKMFKEQYQHMLEHLYYMYMMLQYNDSKNHSKIKKL